MKQTLKTLACALAIAVSAATPAAAYIDPGTGSMLLQVIGAGIAGAIFYFREIRIKLKSLFSRRGEDSVEDATGPSSGDSSR